MKTKMGGNFFLVLQIFRKLEVLIQVDKTKLQKTKRICFISI